MYMLQDMTDIDFKEIGTRCAAFRARKAARMVTRLYDEALRPSDLKITQFTLLVAIKAGAPQSVTELAEMLGLERTTLTRNLAVLERDGLVVSAEDENGRARHISVTDKGLERLKDAYPYWKEAQAKLETALGSDEWQAARDALHSLGAVG